ncbi:MAG: TackOD1 domain-containing metal-binding protein [Nitrososphaerales archaeon]
MTSSLALDKSEIFSELTSYEGSGAILLIGPLRSGKSTFAIQFANAKLKSGSECIFVLTTSSTEALFEISSRIGANFFEASNAKLTMIDCYSASSSSSVSIPPNATLQDILNAIDEASRRKNNYLLVIDDISSLVAYAPPDASFKFIQTIVTKVRRDKSLALLLLIPGVIDQKLETLCLSISEGCLETTIGEAGQKKGRVRMLRRKNLPSKWFEFEIKEGGIFLVEETSELESLVIRDLGNSPRVYPNELARKIGTKTELVEAMLLDLAHRGIVIAGEEELRMSCPKCNSPDIETVGMCSKCSSKNFGETTLIEHYSCGNVSPESTYQKDICPKCRKTIKLVGVDYRRREKQYWCRDCNEVFSEPKKEYVCSNCGSILQSSSVKWLKSRTYGLAMDQVKNKA